MTFHITIIGVGPMAAIHAKTLKHIDGFEVTACVSRSLEKAEAFAAEHGIARGRAFDDFVKKPETDALWVVAPADVMDELALQLNGLGLPMFLEKPIRLPTRP